MSYGADSTPVTIEEPLVRRRLAKGGNRRVVDYSEPHWGSQSERFRKGATAGSFREFAKNAARQREDEHIVIESELKPKLDELHLTLLNALSSSWQNDPRVINSSNPLAVLDNPAYQAFIKAGSSVLPYIFKHYQNSNAPWSIALRNILGHSPVKPENRGVPLKIREDWLAWGRDNGYLR